MLSKVLSGPEAQISQRFVLPLLAEVGVDRTGHVNVGMAQQLLRGVLVHVSLEEQGSVSMTKDMGRQVMLENRLIGLLFRYYKKNSGIEIFDVY